MINETILEVRNLSAGFEDEYGIHAAVEDVSFCVPRGKCVGIVGESGCGKSVTAMSILRLLPRPYGHILGGQVLFHGQDLLKMPLQELRSIRGAQISMVFQEPMHALNPVHTIGDQIAESLILHTGMTRDAAWVEAVNLLHEVRIPRADLRANEYPSSLSGGMRQRAMIAMALACKPELIIADEPTTALDVTVQRQILHLLRRVRGAVGASCLLITHDLGVIAQNCDYVVVMYAGRVVEQAEVKELFANPLHAYTKALLSAMPRLEYEPKSFLPTIPGSVPAVRDYVPGCRFCQRCNVPTERLTRRPKVVEALPGHWVEACPVCAPLPASGSQSS